jgi:hypothetical protein
MATGAAVAYVPSSSNFAIIPGNPACDPKQYARTITMFKRLQLTGVRSCPSLVLTVPRRFNGR